MKKLTIILLAIFGLVLVGCTEDELKEWDFFWGISPVATPTPDVETAQSNLDNWLDKYLDAGKLW